MEYRRESKSYWWIWSFIPFLNWLSWLHLSFVCSIRKYYLYCIAFLIPNVAVVIVSNTDQSEQTTLIEGLIAIVWLAAWIYGIVSTLKEKSKLKTALLSGAEKPGESHSTKKPEALSDYKIKETSFYYKSERAHSAQAEVLTEQLITSSCQSDRGLFTKNLNLSRRSLFFIACAFLTFIVIGGLFGLWDDETISSHHEASTSLLNTQLTSTQNTTPSSQVSYAQSADQDQEDEPIESYSEQYWINASARLIGYRKFEVDVKTNIPGSFQLGASFQLQGQDPEDLFIGTQFIRVPISNGTTTFIIDGTYITFPEDGLPSGDYWIRIFFSHYWSGNSAVVRATNIDSIIEELIPVRID